MTKMYRFLQMIFRPIYKLFFRVEVIGLENELKEGACIICANHISMHDIFFIGTRLKRQIYFFAKKELLKIRFSERSSPPSVRSPSIAARAT